MDSATSRPTQSRPQELLSSPLSPPRPVRVIRSTRRTKTSSARLVDGVIEVRLPAWMSDHQAEEAVADLVERVRRASELARSDVDLVERARVLAARFSLPEPAEISWSTRQQKRWGSCTPAMGTIRISARLRVVPRYVLDSVILHELAHLVEAGHGPAFRALEARHPHRTKAEGFLEAMSLGCAHDQYVSRW